MILDPAQEAISAALSGDWDSAITINHDILSQDPNNIEALNRLARAYSEKGNFKRARQLAKKVLKIDPFNSIATKCLQKWRGTDGKTESSSHHAPIDPKTFLEESGKTKITNLLNLGDSATLATLSTGDMLRLNAAKHRVSVATINGRYVGRLTDDLSARLRKLIKTGNKYEVLVKSVEPDNVRVFIREIERAGTLSDTPSFPTEKIEYVSFTPPELVHKRQPLAHEDDFN
ncbi:tetratricopeptide repeat protein [Candidatus Woesebacteria bacterium]|nr:tetratricopeptide repeat protein [Candidatus Woesebacteria bacterium]